MAVEGSISIQWVNKVRFGNLAKWKNLQRGNSANFILASPLNGGNFFKKPGRVAQSVGHLTRKSGVPGSIPGLATYFRSSFRFFKKGSCQLLAKVCARSTG